MIHANRSSTHPDSSFETITFRVTPRQRQQRSRMPALRLPCSQSQPDSRIERTSQRSILSETIASVACHDGIMGRPSHWGPAGPISTHDELDARGYQNALPIASEHAPRKGVPANQDGPHYRFKSSLGTKPKRLGIGPSFTGDPCQSPPGRVREPVPRT